MISLTRAAGTSACAARRRRRDVPHRQASLGKARGDGSPAIRTRRAHPSPGSRDPIIGVQAPARSRTRGGEGRGEMGRNDDDGAQGKSRSTAVRRAAVDLTREVEWQCCSLFVRAIGSAVIGFREPNRVPKGEVAQRIRLSGAKIKTCATSSPQGPRQHLPELPCARAP